MANALQSYVEKFLLNPGTLHNIDEDGHPIESAQVVDKLTGDEAPSSITSVSKLRMRNATLLSDKDPRYKGNKVSRKDLKSDEDTYDPELAKLCMVEASESEDEDEDEDNDMPNNSEGDDDDDDDDDRMKGKNSPSSLHSDDDDGADILNDSEGEDDDSMGGNNSASSVNSDEDEQLNDSGLISDDDDDQDLIDYSQFADDAEEDESDDEDEGMSQRMESLQKLISEDDSDELKKAEAVQYQLDLFDSLFSMRISLQKLLISSKQLPQPGTYKTFHQQDDPNYITNLRKARKQSKSLMSSLFELQDLLLTSNCETKHIVTGKKAKSSPAEGSDEEITSSEDEDEDIEDEEETNNDKKRKLNVEECEEHLNKRFAGIVPFRDTVYTKWYEKTKLLSTHKSQSKFEKFEISALQQLKNILNDREFLIRRTQLTSISRGNTARTLGKPLVNEVDTTEEYDPEIFDDSDFYKRMLEDVLKSKVALSDNMVDVSRKWIEIQNLRRKVKKKVDTKASKGRKTRFDVMSKMQQLMAPCRPSTMDDMAINTLFRSLFGNAVQKQHVKKT